MSIDLSLHRIQALLGCLPPYTRPTIHVAGTNGKGSVCALLTAVLLAADANSSSGAPLSLSVGRFNSPHLVDVLDCITLSNAPVSQALYDEVRADVEETDHANSIGASSFELLTATALMVFEKANVDVVVCEVGMGGRLDATNAIPNHAILASVITSIDLDHQAFLGSTVSDIAREKAGIARKGKPLVVSHQSHKEVIRVVKQCAEEVGAELIFAPIAVDRPWDESIDGPLPAPFSLTPFHPPPPRPVEMSLPESEPYRVLLSLQGDHQLMNLGAALSVIHLLQSGEATAPSIQPSALDNKTISQGVQQCTWPGRLSFHTYMPNDSDRPLTILADGAHNRASSETLAAYTSTLLDSLARTRKTVTLTYILGLSYSPPKTPEDVLAPLFSRCPRHPHIQVKTRVAFVRFTPPAGMPWVKSVAPSQLREVVKQLGSSNSAAQDMDVWSASDEEITDNTSLEQALEWAADVEENEDTLIVVAGSLYLVADLYRLLGE